jgi:hypothetical protein
VTRSGKCVRCTCGPYHFRYLRLNVGCGAVVLQHALHAFERGAVRRSQNRSQVKSCLYNFRATEQAWRPYGLVYSLRKSCSTASSRLSRPSLAALKICGHCFKKNLLYHACGTNFSIIT